MRKFFRLMRRIGSIIGTTFYTLRQYKKISKQFKDDKEGYVAASMALSNEAMSRLNKAANVDIVFNGAAVHKGPAIYIANHMSFLDAPMIGSVLNTSFVSKAETGEQPFVGPMLRALSTTFIKRTSDDLPRVKEHLSRKLNEGRNIMFFPEATTTDGSFVLPFRAGILQTLFNKSAQDDTAFETKLPEDLRVQAFTIRLTHINGINVEENRSETQHLRDIFTNHLGSPSGVFNEMLHTFKYMATIENSRVEITAHDPLNPYEYEDGKALINAARDQVVPLVADNVDPNLELWELYREGRPGWKAPKAEMMDAMKPASRKLAPSKLAPSKLGM